MTTRSSIRPLPPGSGAEAATDLPGHAVGGPAVPVLAGGARPVAAPSPRHQGAATTQPGEAATNG